MFNESLTGAIPWQPSPSTAILRLDGPCISSCVHRCFHTFDATPERTGPSFFVVSLPYLPTKGGERDTQRRLGGREKEERQVSSARTCTSPLSLTQGLYRYASGRHTGHPVRAATRTADRPCGRTVTAGGGRAYLSSRRCRVHVSTSGWTFQPTQPQLDGLQHLCCVCFAERAAKQTQQRCCRPSSPSRSVGARLGPIKAVAYA